MKASFKSFEAFLKQEVKNKSLYAWGGQGEAATETNIKRRESDTAQRARVMKLYNARKDTCPNMRLFDCSGLGVCFFLEKGLIKSDKTANGIKGLCTKISKDLLQPGDFLFKCYTSGNKKGNAYHIGYYIGNNRLIEAKGRDYGVIETTLDSKWNYFGRPSFWSEIPTDLNIGQDVAFTLTRLLKKKSPLMSGVDVKELQSELIERGFSCGKAGVDGKFGKDTEAAVVLFQRSKNIEDDGVVGKVTSKALGWKFIG